MILSVDLIEEAIGYCDSTAFQNRLDEFETSHEFIFESMGESKHNDEDIPIEAAHVFAGTTYLINLLISILLSLLTLPLLLKSFKN